MAEGMKDLCREAVDLEVCDVHKSYRAQKVLDGVSLRVEPGQIFVIMGPSGAGKSVLLKQIIGLEKPDSGEILIAGMDASDPRTHQKVRTGIVFQAGALFNSLTVYDNLALYPREHRLCPEREIRARVMEALRVLSLEDAVEKRPAELSGGMRKRVALARSLVMQPQLLLYDEPTSELDPMMGATISELIATVREETGLTSVVVSHDRDLAMAIGDRVALLVRGRLACNDTPEQVRNCNEPIVQEFLNPHIDPANPRFRVKEATA